MANKPTALAPWAKNLVQETIDGQTYVNKIQPPSEFTDSGVKAFETWSRPFLNYQLYVLSTWIEWLDQAIYPVGTFVTVNSLQITNPAVDFGVGTWTNHGTDTLAGQTVQVWERIS